MKSITVTADDSLVEQAEAVAAARKTTLDQLFHDWLADLVSIPGKDEHLASLFHRLDYVQSGGPFARDEMNER